jgi:hypothetical protein
LVLFFSLHALGLAQKESNLPDRKLKWQEAPLNYFRDEFSIDAQQVIGDVFVV